MDLEFLFWSLRAGFRLTKREDHWIGQGSKRWKLWVTVCLLHIACGTRAYIYSWFAYPMLVGGVLKENTENSPVNVNNFLYSDNHCKARKSFDLQPIWLRLYWLVTFSPHLLKDDVLEQVLRLSKALADIIVPQEYGMWKTTFCFSFEDIDKVRQPKERLKLVRMLLKVFWEKSVPTSRVRSQRLLTRGTKKMMKSYTD